MLKYLPLIKHINRMAVLLSFGLYASDGMAQVSLSDRLSHVLEMQDMEAGSKLYSEISDDDLKQLPDSSLFDYHYLGAYLNSEIPNHEKEISHLLEAKRLCDKSLGTHFLGYLEIIDELGKEYLDATIYLNVQRVVYND